MYCDKETLAKVRKCVETQGMEYGKEQFAGEKSFEVFYHLSEMRESLFNWYDFRSEASLLEIGSECGALTNLFCKRCRCVTAITEMQGEADIIERRCEKTSNLKIYTGLSGVDKLGKFDYIVLTDRFQYIAKGSKNVSDYTKELLKIVELLEHNGVLLIATENRYGIRYFCGEREPITGQPFAGLNRDTGDGYMLSRKELISAVTGIAGMEYKMYYPVPDYRFPQMIYTDDKLPESNIKERILTYSLSKETLVMSEKRLYDDIVENNVFPFFSNSFLIECSKDKCNFSDVIYAALSTDRGDKHGFATTIHSDDSVKKSALDNNGREALRRLVENIKEISEHGIKVVPHELYGAYIRMPRYDFPTLSLCLQYELKQKSKRFVEYFDLLYDNILRSSERAELRQSECFQINDDPEYWGPILRRAYIDMIPINCFVDDETLLFFDQEFVKENYPAGYIMFRALKYTYQFMPYADSIIPLKSMKERYKISDVWGFYSEVEKSFVSDNRQMEKQEAFWSMCKIDNKVIKSNIERLDLTTMKGNQNENR